MGTISKLHNYTYKAMSESFPEIDIKENAYPDWLVSSNHSRLELDIYLESIGVAIEVQGRQHYEFVPHFHGTQENFEKRKMYDREKKDLCAGNKVRLYEVATKEDVRNLIFEISDNRKHARMPSSKFNKANDAKSYKSKCALSISITHEKYVKKPTKRNKEQVKKFLFKYIIACIREGDKEILNNKIKGICYSILTQDEINQHMAKWEAKGRI